MFDLVDIHCHALSNVDDGAASEEAMKAMLDIAYNDGIKSICFTPHFKTYEFASEEEIRTYIHSIDENFLLAKEYATEKYSDLNLFLGNEIMYHSDFFDSLESDFCKSINRSSYVLIEFQPSTSRYDIENVISRILRKGYKPVIAHIERYSAFVRKPDLVFELRSLGAVMQVNARSILKFRFGKIARFLKLLLKRRQVDVVASDGHDSSIFTPTLSKSMLYVSKKYGENYAEKIFSKNPLSILNNEKIN